MPVEGVHSVEEKRALVYEYLRVRHGGKARFLAERGISGWQIRRWRAMVFAGTLEVGLVPRGGLGVTAEDRTAVKRLLEENEALRAQLAAREEDLVVQQRAVDALGKAIEILHRNGAVKSSDNDHAEVRDNRCKPSSQR